MTEKLLQRLEGFAFVLFGVGVGVLIIGLTFAALTLIGQETHETGIYGVTTTETGPPSRIQSTDTIDVSDLDSTEIARLMRGLEERSLESEPVPVQLPPIVTAMMFTQLVLTAGILIVVFYISGEVQRK